MFDSRCEPKTSVVLVSSHSSPRKNGIESHTQKQFQISNLDQFLGTTSKTQDDINDEDEILDFFGPFDMPLHVESPTVPRGKLPTSSSSSSASSFDEPYHFEGEYSDEEHAPASPPGLASSRSPGKAFWEDEWFRWERREGSVVSNDGDAHDKVLPELEFGCGPEEGLDLKCEMVWI